MKTPQKGKKKVSSKSSLCDNIVTKKNKTLHIACKKVETKLKNKSFRRKLIIASVIFLLFNLVIILMLAKKTIAYKLTKYFANKILEGADPKEKEIIAQIQNTLPVLVEFVNKHSDTIKKANDNYIYYSNMYNDFVKAVSDHGELDEFVIPGSFPQEAEAREEGSENLPPLPDIKLDETQAKKLIDDLVRDSPKKDNFPFFLMNLY
jgi:hypothetical protein